MNKSGSYFKYFEKEELKILTLFDTVIGTQVPLRTKVAPWPALGFSPRCGQTLFKLGYCPSLFYQRDSGNNSCITVHIETLENKKFEQKSF